MKVRVKIFDPCEQLIRVDVLDLDKVPWSMLLGRTGYHIGRIELDTTGADATPGCWIAGYHEAPPPG